MKPLIYFRADGNAQMGLGHVIRSLAMSDMLQEDFDCHFIIRNPLPALKHQILEVCKSIIELPDTEQHNEEAQHIAEKYLTGKEIVVLDGYLFRTEYQHIIKNTGCKLVCIDDIHAYHFLANVVINHIGGIPENKYSKEPYTKLFLGPDYSLLRKEFYQEVARQKKYNQNENNYSYCLLCMGGSDPHNCTLSLVKHLTDIKKIKRINIIIGESYLFSKELKLFAGNVTECEIYIYKNINSQGVAKLIKDSDFGIFPASTIALEAQALNLPIMVGYHVDNQMEAYKYWVENNFSVGLENLNYTTYDQLTIALERMRTITPFKLRDAKKNILRIFKEL